jgi:hypothetical protein
MLLPLTDQDKFPEVGLALGAERTVMVAPAPVNETGEPMTVTEFDEPSAVSVSSVGQASGLDTLFDPSSLGQFESTRV